MKCPLVLREVESTFTREKVEFSDCLKEECAWWQPEHGHCAVVACVEAADKLRKTPERWSSKIPLGGNK
jgi:hypothetical protein